MLDKISKAVLLLLLTELCLGGGGRFTAAGPISLRMILFGLALLITLISVVKGATISNSHLKLLLAFGIVIALGIGMGLTNQSPSKPLWEDVKPLLYFLVLPFFALTINKNEIIVFSKIIKVSSLIIALSFFILLLLIHTGIIPFLAFYRFTLKSEELFYRGELTFFYKGFLFLGIGIIFFFFNSENKKLPIALLLAAIALSITRGLLFSLCITFSFFYLIQREKYRAIFFAGVAIAIAIWGNQFTISMSRWLDSTRQKKTNQLTEALNPNLFGARNYSDEGRLAQIKEVKESVSWSSWVVGHGFGQGIPSRPVHMEIAYLEVFHKQGIFGLMFWGGIAVMIFLAFHKSDQSGIAHAFLFSSLFIFIESATNQYFNNPIGMSVLLLSLVSLDKLKREQ